MSDFQIDFDVQAVNLDNGLKVFLVPDPMASLVSVRTYVMAGSIDEDPYLGAGLSHYLEHLVAGGSTHVRKESEYMRILSELGGAYNAYTTTDHTSYYINTVPEQLETALGVLSEWMFSCSLNPTEVKREQQVISREIEKNLADVGRQFYQLTQENFYKTHPLRLPVIGYLENFKRIKRDQLQAYYDRFYVASNMILVVGGPMDRDKVLAHIRGCFGKAPRVAPPKRDHVREPLPFTERYTEAETDTAVTYLSLRFSTVDLFSKDLYALDLLDFILGNGEDSLLYKRIVEDDKLAYSVVANSYTPNTTTGYFDISLEIDYSQLSAAKAAVLDILNAVKSGDFLENRVKRAQKQKVAEDVFSISTIEDKVNRVGYSYLYGYSTRFYDHYLQEFKKVTKADVVRVANQYLDFERMVITVMKPRLKQQKKTRSVSSAAAVVSPSFHVLDNGIRVVSVADASLPRVYMRLFMMGGIRAETAANNGVGYLVSDLLGDRSKQYSKEALKQLIEDCGAQMGGSMGNNTFYYSLECLSEDFEMLSDVFAETVLHPVFTQGDLSESRRQVLKSIQKRHDDWYRFGMYHFRQFFYGKHPYALSVMGESDSVNAILPEQLSAHYKQLIVPSQMVMTVFGDVALPETLDRLNRRFGQLRSEKSFFDATVLKKRSIHRKSRQRTLTISQDVGALFVGFDGLEFTHNDSVVLDVLDAVLTGASYPAGRLHPILREKGLVYLVHGVNQLGIERGYYLIYALSTVQQLDDVQRIVFEQIDDIKHHITPKEFDEAVMQVRFANKDKVSALDALSMATATDELYGLGFDHYLQLDRQLDRVTIQSVQELARRILVNAQVLRLEKDTVV